MTGPLLQLFYAAVAEVRDGGIAEVDLDETWHHGDVEVSIAVQIRRDPRDLTPLAAHVPPEMM